MTAYQKNYIKLNAIPFTTLIVVISFIVYQSRWQSEVDSHITDSSIHMELEREIQIFVPRAELEGKMDRFIKQLDRIEDKLDKK